jgi:cytidine deaminase
MAQQARQRRQRAASPQQRESDRDRLLAEARAAAEHAYAPYSRFRVGAAVVVVTPDGPEVVTGANVENASFGLTLCAERAALAAASLRVPPPSGDPHERRPLPITHVAIACIDAPVDAPASGRMPCGACRQWLAELAPDAIYYVDGVQQDLRLADILPSAFHLAE